MGSALMVAMSVSISSCKDDDGEDDPIPTATEVNDQSNVVVASNIESGSKVTWTADKVIELRGLVKVKSGGELTIEPGTIIKGRPGQGASASALLVARGGKIYANGTAAQPIIFTTTLDGIQPGYSTPNSPNLAPTVQGQWGGLIVLGHARVSTGNSGGGSFDVKQIEGIDGTDTDGEYGGTNDQDSSGVITYVSIRHGGSNIGQDNEINGLTLGGVGSKTVINNIEIVANKDDGIEFFGGTVSVSDVVVWNNGDDALDTDQSYNGTVSNFALIGSGGSPFELDGPEGTYINGNHTLMNGAIVSTRPNGGLAAEDLINYDENSNVDLKNLSFTEISAGQKVNSKDRSTAPNVSFMNIVLDVDSTSLVNYMGSGHTSPIPSGITAGKNSSYFDESGFFWTWANYAGVLNGL